MSLNETGIGGVKEAIVEVSGDGAYSRLKFEGGTHRVQRVPATESSGRIHTSTATVVVLPAVEASEIEIDEERDLRIDVKRSSGRQVVRIGVEGDTVLPWLGDPEGVSVVRSVGL